MMGQADCADIFMEILCSLGYILAAADFCRRYFDISLKNRWMFVLIYMTGRLLLHAINGRYLIPYILLTALGHILFMGLVLLMFRAEWEKKFLAASILMTVITLAGNFCESFISCLMLIHDHSMQHIPEPFPGRWESVLTACAGLLLVMLLTYRMAEHMESVFYGKPGKWYVTLALLLVVITAVTDVANWGAAHGILVRGGENPGAYYDQIFSHAGICVLTGLSMFAAGIYVTGMNRIYLEQEKNGRYRSQIEAYRMLEEQDRQTERLRHDMKNHIIALSGLFQNQEWEKMGDYLRKMEDGCPEAGMDMTGNRVVDALLYQKRKRAEREGIRWECDLEMPKKDRIGGFDLCVLFGNILDNALQACERQDCREGRFVSIRGKTVKKCFLLEARNSMDMTEKPGGGQSVRKKSKEHGTGLRNVSDMVRRYDGVMKTEAADGVFMISVLIPFGEGMQPSECRI